jgi:hypothetical protein
MLDCTRRGDLVLDAFLGSGTSVIAAERVGRCCYGLELDPVYVDTTFVVGRHTVAMMPATLLERPSMN